MLGLNFFQKIFIFLTFTDETVEVGNSVKNLVFFAKTRKKTKPFLQQ